MSQKLTEINFGLKNFWTKTENFWTISSDNEIAIKIFGGCKNGSFCPKLSKSFRHF